MSTPPRWRPLPSAVGLDPRSRPRAHGGRVKPWSPQPAAMALDLVLLTAPPEVQALVWRLAAVSEGGRVDVGETPETPVTALCGGAPWAAAAFRDAVRLKLVRMDAGVLVLPRWEWPTLAREAPVVSSGEATPARSPRTFALRDAERRLGALWSKAGAKTLDQRKTWLDSTAGQAFLDREAAQAPEGHTLDRAWAEGVAARVRTVGVTANHGQPLAELATANHGQLGGQPTANPTSPSHSPSGENNKKEDGSEPREARPTRTANPANSTHGQPTANPANRVDGSSSPPGAGAPYGVGPSGKGGKKALKEPPPDTIPMPGTAARAVYDAILHDPALRPITGNPGDFALRISDPATYPGVNVLAEVKRAGEWASAKPGKYSDGRAFLRNWLQRKAEDAAKAPKPAPAPVRPAPPSRPEPPRRVLTKEESIAEWKRVQQQEENAHVRP